MRIAWVEEWMSTLAREVLPRLSLRHEVTYVTTGDEVPRARFARVIRGPRRQVMNLAGFELSRRVNALHRDGLIDLAMVWASIGFGLRGVPFINMEGTSVYAEIGLFASRRPWHRRAGFLTGLLHFALPEMVCNRRAERVIVPSAALKRDVVRLHGLRDDRVVVVPHGVEPRHLACYERRVGSHRPRILYVGRLHYRKGILDVVREFIRRPEIEADFLIAGDGPDRDRLRWMAQGDPRLEVLGPVGREELETLLTTTQIFVLPTFYEGFGLSLLEAMASGHTCLCYDIPVVREVLGDTGVLTPMGDPAAFVEALARLVADPAAVAARAALAHARARTFSWPDACASIEAIARETWRDVARRRPAARRLLPARRQADPLPEMRESPDGTRGWIAPH
jgi:glycosyltransferase involved in cell wall biosynthesis